MSSDKEHLMEFGDESGGLGAIHEEGAPEADMIARHEVNIGEMEDPDPTDSRDEEEQEEGSEESKSEGGGTRNRHNRSARSRRSHSSPRVSIALSGPIAEAVTAIQTHYEQHNAVEVIKFCVLRVWRDLEL